MKKNQVTIGNVYTAKVSGNLARVRITGENPHGGWDGLNLDTRRKVRIKTAGRLHRQIADPDAAPPSPEADAQPEAQEAPPETTPATPEPQEAAQECPASIRIPPQRQLEFPIHVNQLKKENPRIRHQPTPSGEGTSLVAVLQVATALVGWVHGSEASISPPWAWPVTRRGCASGPVRCGCWARSAQG